jgi:hypothetical protein
MQGLLTVRIPPAFEWFVLLPGGVACQPLLHFRLEAFLLFLRAFDEDLPGLRIYLLAEIALRLSEFLFTSSSLIDSAIVFRRLLANWRVRHSDDPTDPYRKNPISKSRISPAQ